MLQLVQLSLAPRSKMSLGFAITGAKEVFSEIQGLPHAPRPSLMQFAQTKPSKCQVYVAQLVPTAQYDSGWGSLVSSWMRSVVQVSVLCA